IELKIDKEQPNMVAVASGFSLFHLPYLKAEKFPRIDVGNFECKFALPITSMQRLIEKNRYTISLEDARYHLNGIYLHPILESNELRATATDGHRLSSSIITLPKDAKNMQPVIVPRKTIFELSKIIADKENELQIETSATKIKFTIDGITMVSKLIDANFPEYLPLIPYNNELYFSIFSSDLAQAVDRVTTILIAKSQAIEFIINGSELQIQAGGDNQSLANEKLEINSNMENFIIPFNARYIIDIMSAIGNETNVSFKFSDQISSVLVQAENDEKTDFVIMPMRV
ncbi:MAG: DNA polymerase III subunit beta, partial [Pseudomonadota bacterium]